jgi:uncharacterized protein YqhQ
MAEKIRLGGMALANGVLVHGPKSWACAIRHPNGRLEVVSERKRFLASEVKSPFLRGPARLLEALAVLPAVRRALPAAKLPFERPAVAAALAGGAVGVRIVRSSGRLGAAAQELVAGFISLAPAVVALRGSELAAYHGAEHVVIGTYEHDEPREREHERCGSHLVGPLLLTTAVGNVLASRAPAESRGAARAAASLGGVAVATEVFGWMVRNPDKRLAKALARPGYELQHRGGTAEPTAEQLEVAEAALRACLELEGDGDGGPDRA